MMIRNSIQLLKKLAPPVRPDYAGADKTLPQNPMETQSFGQLLALVSDGSIKSDRVVTVSFEAKSELTDTQLARLATAADTAEASGAHTALMLIDGRGFVLDVGDRQLLRELEGDEGDQLVKIDAAVYVADPEADGTGTLKLPGTGMIPAVVADQIEQVYEARRQDRAHDNQELNQESPIRRAAG